MTLFDRLERVPIFIIPLLLTSAGNYLGPRGDKMGTYKEKKDLTPCVSCVSEFDWSCLPLDKRRWVTNFCAKCHNLIRLNLMPCNLE